MAFGWDDAFLISMQAAGVVFSAIDTSKNLNLIRQGRELEQEAVNTNLEALRAQSSESSLEAIKQLRENVSNQIAQNSARGTASGAGSAQSALQASEGNFGQDENTRRLNLLVKENELRAAGVLSGLHTLTSETKLGQSLTNQIFNNLPISSLSKLFDSKSTTKNKAPVRSGYGLDPL